MTNMRLRTLDKRVTIQVVGVMEYHFQPNGVLEDWYSVHSYLATAYILVYFSQIELENIVA